MITSTTDLGFILEPFANHSVRVGSVTVLGEKERFRPLATDARGLSGHADSIDVLVSDVYRVGALVSETRGPLAVRGVVVLVPLGDEEAGARAWRLHRELFDRGLVSIGAGQRGDDEARCFLASDLVRSLPALGPGTRGVVSMSRLGKDGGRFANQLFQYAYAKFYALRHGLTAAVPPWEGHLLFELADVSCDDLELDARQFTPFGDADLALWQDADPPIDIDLQGFFQELPACWQPHRSLLRRFFQLSETRTRAMEGWYHEVTDGGRRTLVGIHVRRGDYRMYRADIAPWFRLVPADWYLDWLRGLWPTLREPVLFVATDESESIVPCFDEFDLALPPRGDVRAWLPPHVRDFEMLKRADHLAVCNSSFSRMAALLAPETQRSVLVSFERGGFEPYEPWIDPSFWSRFASAPTTLVRSTAEASVAEGHAPVALTRAKNASAEPGARRTMYVDVSDLLGYLAHRTTVSGIQRVEAEVIRQLLRRPDETLCPVILDDSRSFCSVRTAALLDLIEYLQADAVTRDEVDRHLRRMVARATPVDVRPDDLFVALGALWGVPGAGRLLQELKARGVRICIFVHDIISITDPEYFAQRDTRVFVKGMYEALTFADAIVTTSAFNRDALSRYVADQGRPDVPIAVVPLAREPSRFRAGDVVPSERVAEILAAPFVLCVGTIEIRKNPTYLFNVWKLLRASGRAEVPTLVFVGREGWLVHDFMKQLAASRFTRGNIVVLHDVCDAELNLLYRACLFTMFPSFVEGWGLPVGEALAHGKVCLASNGGAIPEVGGDLVDYIDPYNPRDGLRAVEQYLDDPARLAERERDIARRFVARTWEQVASDLLAALRADAVRPREEDGRVVAIPLPAGRYLPITSDAGAYLVEGTDGELSAEVSCVAGWRWPEPWGVWAAAPTAVLRFRTALPVGAGIHVVLRLTTPPGVARHLRISTGGDVEIEKALSPGATTVATVSAKVEADHVVSITISDRGNDETTRQQGTGPYWGLKGFLYFEPGRGGPPGSAPKGLMSRPRPAAPAAVRRDRVLLSRRDFTEEQRAPSLEALLTSENSFWRVRTTTPRPVPLFVDDADRAIFMKACGHHLDAADDVRLMRRSNQYVSMTRFTEGAVFDRSGAWRGYGFMQASPLAPWMIGRTEGITVREDALAAAPRLDGSHLLYFNGNLHNYYHWMVEGVLCLDVLVRLFGGRSRIVVPLPTSRRIAAVLDHREALVACGLGDIEVTEIADEIVHVREAIWIESDQVQFMPAEYLQAFRQRVAEHHAGTRRPRTRRLLIARRGPTRRIENLAGVEACLAPRGFETVYLEGMRVADQVALFQEAEVVVAAHGAALANLLFCAAGTKVIELAPAVDVRSFFWLIASKLDLVHAMLCCEGVGNRSFQSSLRVDLSRFERLCRALDVLA